jgi:hypothetical protein
MAKIIDKNSFNGSVAKVVELSDELVFNGHIYDKNNFSPKPLNFLPIYTSEFSLDKIANVNSRWNYNRSHKTFITDQENPNITWATPPYFAQKPGYRLIKITNNDGNYEKAEYELSSTSYETHCSLEIISQDSERIYLLSYSSYSTYGATIFSFNKLTNTKQNMQSFGITKLNIFYENSAYFYITYQTGSSDTSLGTSVIKIQKYNKFTGALTTLHEYSTPSSYSTFGSISNFENNSFYMAFNNVKNSGIQEVFIRKYYVDVINDIVSYEDMNFNFELFNLSNIEIGEGYPSIQYDIFTFESNSQKYLSLFRYNNGNQHVYLPISKCELYTFKIEDNNSLKLVDIAKTSPNLILTYFILNNNRTLVGAHQNGLMFYTWNNIKEKFELTSNYNQIIKYVGIDSNNNIWIYLSDGSIELISETLPLKMSAEFINKEYVFSGEDIITTVRVYCTNYSDNFIAANLELSLTGPAEFVNASPVSPKTYVVTSSPSGYLNVDVKITGSGLITINTKYIN